MTTFDKIFFFDLWYSVCGCNGLYRVSSFLEDRIRQFVGSFSIGGRMAKAFTKGFYKTKAWKSCRAGYMASVGGLCERCLRNGLYVPGTIVHHKIHLNPDNMTDPNILLDWSNLELLCRDCHKDEHQQEQRQGTQNANTKYRLRYRFDDFGNVII